MKQEQKLRLTKMRLQGSAGLSASQVYNLPNGHMINLAFTDGFSIGPDGRPTSSNANSITYT